MRFVIKDIDTGHYIGGEAPGPRRRKEGIDKAKLFHRKADAEAHLTRWAYATRPYRYAIVPVTLTEVPA